MIPIIGTGARLALGGAKVGKKALNATRRGIRTRPVESVATAGFAGYSLGAPKQSEAKHPYPRGY